MARQPLDVREWLEDMRRFNGRDADRATEVLAALDAGEASESILCKIIDRAKTGDPETDEIVAQLEALDSLKLWAERDLTFKEFGGMDEDGLQCFVEAYEAKETITDGLHDLMVEAGLLNPLDYVTDPLPLLRMFLPVE